MAAAFNVDEKAAIAINMAMDEVNTSAMAPPQNYQEPLRSQPTGAPRDPAYYTSAPSIPMASKDNVQPYYAPDQNSAAAGIGEQYFVAHMPPPVGPQTSSSSVTGFIPEANKRWHQSFCGCFDNLSICLLTAFFSPVVECCIGYYMGKLRIVLATWSIATIAGILIKVFNSIGQPALALCAAIVEAAVAIVKMILLIMKRIHIRREYGIAGSKLEDICYTWCCTPCSLCQMMAQLDHEYVVSGKKTFFSRN